MASRRALHFVFKVGNRKSTMDFYRKTLGMKVLRHEEFEEGCKAACNGPYDGKWSKTMVGYGPEDDHFVVELTYNYGIKHYDLGNDFQGFTILSNDIFKRLQSDGLKACEDDPTKLLLASPDGHKFIIFNKTERADPVQRISLGVSDLEESLSYWNGLLAMQVIEKSAKSAILSYHKDQCQLELIDVGGKVERGTAFGRVAFSCPREELPVIQDAIKKANRTILTPLVSLDTPGKATVEVVILADPDGHEICFVGDEAFRELSHVDEASEKVLDQAIEADKSDEWFQKKQERATKQKEKSH